MSDTKQTGGQMRITANERATIKAVFKGNDPLLLLMRKILLPEIDPKAPIGQVIDLAMTIKTDNLSPEQIAINVQARNSLIMHVEQCLMQLKLISEMEELTAEQVKDKVAKGSSK